MGDVHAVGAPIGGDSTGSDEPSCFEFGQVKEFSYLSGKMKNRLPTTGEAGDGKFHFSIDRGGTFTDCHARLPDGTEIVSKLLSVDPSNYEDAPTEGIRRILDDHDPNREYPRGEKVATDMIGSIRMGTTVATNALLEREGERMGLVTTKGFGDLLKIGDQTRADM